jgi:AraC-like DNA-binding protein
MDNKNVSMFKALITTFPFFVCLFWLLLLIIDKRYKYLHQRELMVFYFVSSILFFTHSVLFNRDYDIYKYLDSIYLFCTLSVYPLYFIFISTIAGDGYLNGEKKKSASLKYYLLIPAVLISLSSLVAYCFMTDGEISYFIENVLHRKGVWVDKSIPFVVQVLLHRITPFTVLGLIIYIQIKGVSIINNYNHKIENYYSDDDNKKLTGIKALLICFIVTSILTFLFQMLGTALFSNSITLLMIPSFLFGIMLFFVGYYSSKQIFTAYDFIKDINEGDKLELKAESEPYLSDLSQKLITVIERDKLYLKHNLKISDVATAIGTNRTYLSKLINDKYHCPFSDFINNYRIDYFKKYIEQLKQTKSQISLQDAIYISGFASESTFYRVFKKEHNISPLAWINSLK